ncbi:Uncharacterised protein [Phocoenobacter uteri]|uniref:Uncharacterized protein n=1 Tax=Phocoenobacter uteri TaxID=146806 RepID=A0A379C779_9PAST|nr:SIR2 family protein [Phocoenobacter uteri]MDG6882004.1 hypothetical protein [Phocoenobacter uteri]SUB58153.1 Uncharacterised protein [Phocoenobacter uteri]
MERKVSYLERLFIEELNNSGDEIIICGYVFERDRILYELDRTIYNFAFDEWKVNRQRENLSKADDLLKLHNNKNRFQILKGLIEKQVVIPFIGAGLSNPTGLPLWKDFLENAITDINVDIDIFNQYIANYEYENVAQCLEDSNRALLQDHLNSSFGKTYRIDEICGVICRLPDFFPNSTIITTNYDNLIKTIYEENQMHFAEYLDGIYAVEFNQLLSQNQRVLLKLHGSHITSSKRILTKRDYDRHYNDNNTISNCIKSLFSRSILFIGCSLNVDRMVKEMSKFVEQEGADNLTKHYAFLSCENMTDEERKQRMEELSKANIFPIWYDGDHDECIEALLEKLNER